MVTAPPSKRPASGNRTRQNAYETTGSRTAAGNLFNAQGRVVKPRLWGQLQGGLDVGADQAVDDEPSNRSFRIRSRPSDSTVGSNVPAGPRSTVSLPLRRRDARPLDSQHSAPWARTAPGIGVTAATAATAVSPAEGDR